jgi:lysophospholipase L1-like esterase
MGTFRELIKMGQERHIPVIVAQHLEQAEYGQPEAEGHRMFREACNELHVTRIEWAPAFEAEMKAGHSPYRDGIHPNPHGQELMEKAIYPEVAKVLPPSETRP